MVVNFTSRVTVKIKGIQTTLFFIMSSISLVKYRFFYENMFCITSSQCKTETNIMWTGCHFKVWITPARATINCKMSDRGNEINTWEVWILQRNHSHTLG